MGKEDEHRKKQWHAIVQHLAKQLGSMRELEELFGSEDVWIKLLAIARVDLGLTPEQFWEMTPEEMHAYVQRLVANGRLGARAAVSTLAGPTREEQRAALRNTWLNDKLAGRESDVSLAGTGKVSYKTIGRYRHGSVTSQTPKIRRGICEALNALSISCVFSDVPE